MRVCAARGLCCPHLEEGNGARHRVRLHDLRRQDHLLGDRVRGEFPERRVDRAEGGGGRPGYPGQRPSGPGHRGGTSRIGRVDCNPSASS